MTDLLPAGFEALEPWLPEWAHATTDERIQARGVRSMSDIRTFYDAMLPHAEAALRHVEQFDLDALPPAESRLMQLVLALAHSAIAVEVQRAAQVPGVHYPHDIHVLKGLQPMG